MDGRIRRLYENEDIPFKKRIIYQRYEIKELRLLKMMKRREEELLKVVRHLS